MLKNNPIKVIGAGLAGCEAAYQLLKRGYAVELHEMRPKVKTSVHHTGNFAELVCSNSLRSNEITNAAGLLKEEMKIFDSLIISSAEKSSVPAGSALAVDRDNFSSAIKDTLMSFENFTLINEEYDSIDVNDNIIIASGPLTSDNLSNEIKKLVGSEYMYFFDAAAPIITSESINFDIAYYKSRYSDEESDYINCPFTKEEYDLFYDELIRAEVTIVHNEQDKKVFEGCMPIETMAKRGYKTLLFGPLKPVGLEKNENERRPYAVLQLRQDDAAKSLFNLVGFQTSLKWSEQTRLIRLIPGLENAEIIRYGVIHQNNFINSPTLLDSNLSLKSNPNIFFAGQITGVDGYIESASMGIISAINMISHIESKEQIIFPRETVMGSLVHFITKTSAKYFQPMKANFGIVTDLEEKIRDKKEKKVRLSERSIDKLTELHAKIK